MRKNTIIALCLLAVLSALLWPGQNINASDETGLQRIFTLYNKFATPAGLPGTSALADPKNQAEYVIAKIISGIMGFLGVLFLFLSVYGGIRWMWARGNEEEAKKARDIIKDAIIGIAIVLSSYVLTMAITYYLTSATGTT